MSNGTHPRHVPRDSGTQPAVHYCTRAPRADGTIAGCPEWPTCLFRGDPCVTPTAADPITQALAEVPPATPTPLLRGFVETLFWVGLVGMLIGVLWAVLA